jgi:hypothetical protein
MAKDPKLERPVRPSDAPTDLVREREAFVRTFLKKGVEFTEELLRENAELRNEIAQLHSDNARLRAQVASDDAIRDLLRKIEGLEHEKQSLLRKSHELEKNQRQDESRYHQIENELNDLANLYVASQQLHSGLTPRRVVRQVSDILAQLVGAERFVIHVVEPDGKHAVPVWFQGMDDDEVGRVVVGEGPIGDACLTGMPNVKERQQLDPAGLEDPLAVIPLMLDDRAVGTISILSVLEQKERWVSVDEELFNLLGKQAGMALVAANLYAEKSDAVAALATLRDRL